jgi:hypothetical protein
MGYVTIIVNNYQHLMVFSDIKMILGINKNSAIGQFEQQPAKPAATKYCPLNATRDQRSPGLHAVFAKTSLTDWMGGELAGKAGEFSFFRKDFPLTLTLSPRFGGRGLGGGRIPACNFLTGHCCLNPPFSQGDFHRKADKFPFGKGG